MASQKFRPEIRLERNSVIPLCAQLTEQIRSEIIRNRLRSGTRLVSERRLADELEINRNTVHQAYGLLASEDILSVSKVRGGGMVVSENISRHYRAPFPSLNLILPYKFSEQLKFSNLRGLEMIAGVMDRAAEQHISINILDLPDPDSSAENMKAWLDSFVPRSIGVITFGTRSCSFDPAFERLLEDQVLPHVFVSGTSHYPHISSITIDPAPGIREMLKCLKENGHRNLCVIAQTGNVQSQFLNCAYERGLVTVKLAEKAGMHTVCFNIGSEPEDVGMIIDRILTSVPRPTALCAHNDMIAEQLMDHLLARGFQVPEDFSVVGYDDICRKYDLSTMNHSRFEIAHLAVDIIAELSMHSVPHDAVHRKIPGHFIRKSSIGIVNNHNQGG